MEGRQAWVVGVQNPILTPHVQGVSLGLPAINASRRVVFIAPGVDKRSIIGDMVNSRVSGAL